MDVHEVFMVHPEPDLGYLMYCVPLERKLRLTELIR